MTGHPDSRLGAVTRHVIRVLQVLRGEGYSVQSDAYSLTMVLYELFTATQPFDGRI